jgi:hypothetical protein
MGPEESVDINKLRKQLFRALDECGRLRAENARLLNLLADRGETGVPTERIDSPVSSNGPDPNGSESLPDQLSPDAKVSLFRTLFRGREDVYATRWEGKNGRSGYSPACVREWEVGSNGKPKLKKLEPFDRRLFPLTNDVIRDHLTGKHTVGIYPLLLDETCWFLAADFDKKTWQGDAAAFLETCREWEVPAMLERSRSGQGAHIWIFFDRPVQASTARKLGCAILATVRTPCSANN